MRGFYILMSNLGMDLFDPRSAVMDSDLISSPTRGPDPDFGFAFNEQLLRSVAPDRDFFVFPSCSEVFQTLADWEATRKSKRHRGDIVKKDTEAAYLDHAGATLYSELQMEAVLKDFNSTLYGNPHSQNNCSLTTSDIAGEARRQVLDFFNASPEEYKCVFTSGATTALKLVGETFPWSNQIVACTNLKDTEWISRKYPYVCVEYGSTKFCTRTCTVCDDCAEGICTYSIWRDRRACCLWRAGFYRWSQPSCEQKAEWCYANILETKLSDSKSRFFLKFYETKASQRQENAQCLHALHQYYFCE